MISAKGLAVAAPLLKLSSPHYLSSVKKLKDAPRGLYAAADLYFW